MSRSTNPRRVLVIEDELMVAMGLEMLLTDAGCAVVGPHGRFDRAMEAAQNEAVDAALIDVNLRGSKIYPIADVLAERGIPFAFLTGYEKETLPERFAHELVLSKPCGPQDLVAAVARMCEQSLVRT